MELAYKKILLKSCLIYLFIPVSCEKVENLELHLDSIDSNEYYSEEIIPGNFLMIYGKWRLYDVSGGYSGEGYNPDYDYMEIKNIGIYGLVRSDSLFEYGKIQLRSSENYPEDYLPVALTPDFYGSKEAKMNPRERFLYLKGKDSLNMISPCCDRYNYHYIRVR